MDDGHAAEVIVCCGSSHGKHIQPQDWVMAGSEIEAGRNYNPPAAGMLISDCDGQGGFASAPEQASGWTCSLYAAAWGRIPADETGFPLALNKVMMLSVVVKAQ